MSESNAAAHPVSGGVTLPLPMLLGIVLGVAVLVGGGSVAAIMFLGPKPATAEEVTDADTLSETELDEEVVGQAYFSLDEPFIVNLKPNKEFPYTYLKFAVSLEVLDEPTVGLLDAKAPLIQATITGQMNNVDYLEISTESGQRKYAERIKASINDQLSTPDKKTGAVVEPVTNVFFTTLVAQ